MLDTDDSLTNSDINTYISYLTSLLSDIFGVASTYLTVFENVLTDLFQDGDIGTTLYTTGSNTYALFDYPTSVVTMREVQFDNAPMPVEFNLTSTSTATTGFQAYSNITYFVQCIESSTASLIRLSVNCNQATTSTFNLTISK